MNKPLRTVRCTTFIVFNDKRPHRYGRSFRYLTAEQVREIKAEKMREKSARITGAGR